MNKYLAEFLGTALLILIGCGAIVLNDINSVIGHGGVSIAWGLAVTIAILLFGKFSGAHINPAVTLVKAIKQEMTFKDMWLYFAAQVAGAIVASLLLKFIFPYSETLGATLPKSKDAFVMELGASMFLMLIICFSDKSKLAPFFIGFAVFLDAYFVGPFTGASMNPARSIGPALVSGKLDGLWIYIFAPSVGMWGAREIYEYYKRQMDELKAKIPDNKKTNPNQTPKGKRR